MIRRISYILFLLAAVCLLLELAYRSQIIDFYSRELNALNPNLNSKKENVLIFGDSFSADPNSYVHQLRKNFPSYNFINCALPGSGIKQHRLFFTARVERFQPKIILYQFYVGNDFLDIRHAINWNSLPFWRNAYWWISERLQIIQYFNFKMAFLNVPNNNSRNLKEKRFSPSLYNKRTAIYLKGNPAYLENTIGLREEQGNNYAFWKNEMSSLLADLNEDVSVFFIPIPHHAQLSRKNEQKMRIMNAELNLPVQEVNYKLLKQIKQDLPSLKVINPLENFQLAEKRGLQLYFENDPHLTIKGQRLLAELIAERLTLSTPFYK